MAVEPREIPALIFWIFVAGLAFFAAAKATGKVSERVSAILK